MMISNNQEVSRWFNDNGDYTHNITYNLDEDSIVLDLGAYTGIWAQQIINKYNPNIYLIEPVPNFYETLIEKFSNNKKVKMLNVGVSTKNIDGILYVNKDGTSAFNTSENFVTVKFNTIDTILENFKLKEVDLIQINIEGGEYDLLEHMLKTGSINKFKNLQIQFHLGVADDIERREKIRQGLISNNFKNNFDYPFVWESWGK